MYFLGIVMKVWFGLAILAIGQMANAAGQNISAPQILKHIYELVKQGEQMNLKHTANVLNAPKLYSHAVFSSDGDKLFYRYDFEPDSPLQEIRYQIWLDMRQGFGVAAGAVDYHFKQGQCPAIDTYEAIFGVPVVTHQIPLSPSLWTGKGGTYDLHYFYLPNNKVVSVTTDGCQVGVSANAKLS